LYPSDELCVDPDTIPNEENSAFEARQDFYCTGKVSGKLPAPHIVLTGKLDFEMRQIYGNSFPKIYLM